MATFSWVRKFIAPQVWTSAQQSTLITKLNSGQSIITTRIAWGFGGTTSTLVVPTATQANLAALGAVTTVGNGTESPPDAANSPNNANPPTQRWLYWATRAPTVVSWDTANYTAIWQSSPPEGDSLTEGQVLAPSNMGAGNTLNLWVTWNTVNFWDASGLAVLWFNVQTLVRTPLWH